MAVASGRTDRDRRLTLLAGVASVSAALALIGIKFWAWTRTDSIALLSSLADSLLDLLASMLTLAAVRFAAEPADREHRFGHGKLEAVAGLVQALIISASAVYVAVKAVDRLLSPTVVAEPSTGIAVMVLSLLVTLGLLGLQRFVIARTGSLAIRADSLHYAGDVLTSIMVLIAIGLNASFGWYAADPLLGLVVVAVILASVRQILRQAMDVLLDRELPAPVRAQVLALARAHPAVRGVHDLRTRTSSVDDFVQLHLELDPDLTLAAAHRISEEVEVSVRDALPRAEVIIHIDPHGLSEPRDSF